MPRLSSLTRNVPFAAPRFSRLRATVVEVPIGTEKARASGATVIHGAIKRRLALSGVTSPPFTSTPVKTCSP
jgi:hypothetical protein